MGKVFVDTIEQWSQEIDKREKLYEHYQEIGKDLLQKIEKDNSYENQKAIIQNIRNLDASYLDIENIFFNNNEE